MFHKIKKQIDKELRKFVQNMDKLYSLSKISPLLYENIKDFVLRDGKRIRPILFIIGYRGFAQKTATNLCTSAIAIELLHDFLLVHDDIIDKSETRRGKPAMHTMFNHYLVHRKNIKLNGQDLAIVVGDVMYAMAIHAFLSIKENMERKEKALKKFIESVIYTGGGEFIELIIGINDIEKITKKDILNIYDYKTARYTFACPLSTGAILAGAAQKEIDKLFDYGIYLGRAFQIKDDILGMFGEEKDIGKSPLTDLQEAKKTLLIWQAYHNTNKENKKTIKRIFSKEKVNRADLIKIRKIVIESKALENAKKEIYCLQKKAQHLITSSKINPIYKDCLDNFTKNLLSL